MDLKNSLRMLAQNAARCYSMIRKSGYWFSEKIVLKQEAKAKCRFNLK